MPPDWVACGADDQIHEKFHHIVPLAQMQRIFLRDAFASLGVCELTSDFDEEAASSNH
ncbi:MAG: hypothetical protein PHT58_06525 [Eubacteriales bacterium]|nr:hypothetical protein [Eubacteriales bacterium]